MSQSYQNLKRFLIWKIQCSSPFTSHLKILAKLWIIPFFFINNNLRRVFLNIIMYTLCRIFKLIPILQLNCDIYTPALNFFCNYCIIFITLCHIYCFFCQFSSFYFFIKTCYQKKILLCHNYANSYENFLYFKIKK